jgi:hypothetical protein
MKKLTPQLHLDAEYIQLCRLPFDQLMRFRAWMNDRLIFTITDTFGENHQCAPYDMYDFWYDTLMQEKEERDLAIF